MKYIINIVDKIKNNRYDSITRLYNRNSFYSITDKMLKKHYDEEFIMVNMDILNFKIINEFYGSEQGDLLLNYVGKIIKKFFYEESNVTYSREQGDIFFICFKDEKNKLNEFMEYMINKLNTYNLDFVISPYFGIYRIHKYDESSENIQLICDSSKLALKTVKGDYINHFAYFKDKMRVDFNKKVSVVNDMNKALKENEFEIYLQPKCSLLNKSCVGAEALVRWNHPDKGLIFPMDFIPIFEENSFIIKLDEYMIEKSCIIIKQWMESGKKVVPISVNISQSNLNNEELYDTLVKIIEKYEVPVSLLELEITETLYIKNQKKIKKTIKKLQDYGFKILMDDFGSGYSSLSSLNELAVDVLKLDLKFLNNLTETSKSCNIISMVVDMSKSLGIEIIAEGLESIEHINFLKSVGCVVGQGYYFSKPIRVKAFEDLFLINVDNQKLNTIDVTLNNIKSSDDFNILFNENKILAEALSECSICVWEYDIINSMIIQTGTSRQVHGGNTVIKDVPSSLISKGHIHKNSVDEFMKVYELLHKGIKELSCIVKVRRVDGSWWWEKINYITSFDECGKPVRALGISYDVTTMMANKLDKKEELYKIAYKDELTDIGNRRACFNYINELINNDCYFSVSYIDLDCLKFVNDKYGHNKGDEYIKLVVDIIKGSIRGRDELFRIGGDEFVYIMKNGKKDIIKEKLHLLDLKIKSLNLEYNASVSYGTVFVEGNTSMSCDDVLEMADKEMYKHKNNKSKSKIII